jgi:thioredoxin reductase
MRDLPVAVIGGGPIGLAAAAHLAERGLPVRVYEAGLSVGASVLDWGHVRIFSPWKYNIDPAAQALLARQGWVMPPAEELPTGAELYDHYLRPLAETPELTRAIETGARVELIARQGIDKAASKDRNARPFRLRIRQSDGSLRHDLARAVIDASGTWTQPNPLGGDGLVAPGERKHADRIAYGMPDVLGRDRASYAGRHTVVVGAGYSAANVLLDLAQLAGHDAGTVITWVVRGSSLVRVYGGGLADELPARGALGWRLKELVDRRAIDLVLGFAATAVEAVDGRIGLAGETAGGPLRIGPADRIVVATGQRPDLTMTRELRLELDPWLESVKALGPMIDPNLHSCGSVEPHGYRELGHPEPDFYTIGVKSYGRAPTFLLLTGYEQARSVAAAIAGDLTAAESVQLVLPDTGICQVVPVEGTDASAQGCCGGPPPVRTEGCCMADVTAKAAGQAGCGCGPGG